MVEMRAASRVPEILVAIKHRGSVFWSQPQNGKVVYRVHRIDQVMREEEIQPQAFQQC